MSTLSPLLPPVAQPRLEIGDPMPELDWINQRNEPVSLYTDSTCGRATVLLICRATGAIAGPGGIGIVRTQDEMNQAVEKIAALKQRADQAAAPGNREYNPGWHTALDLHNLLTVSAAVARAAARRQDSRGAHFREDYPDNDEEWGKTSLVVKKGSDGKMEISREPVMDIPAELQVIIEENG